MPLPSDTELLNLSKEIIETLQTMFGKHKGSRPVHAKGVYLSGTFTPTEKASSLSKAPHFTDTSTPITVRFSNSTGFPTIPDNSPDAEPRGLAIRFNLGPHQHTDIIGHSTPFFPARTGQELLEFFKALIASEPGMPSPTPVEEFLAAHPAAVEFVTAKKPIPPSFSETTYWMLHAFKLISPEGKETFVKYHVRPEHESVSAFSAAVSEPNFLIDEINTRVEREPVRLILEAQIAGEGDATNDVTAKWPVDREVVKLGEVSIGRVVDDEEVIMKTIFDPIPRVEGVEPSDDPVLAVRAAVYLMAGKQRRSEA